MSDYSIKEIVEDCESALRASNHGLDSFTKEKMESLLEWWHDHGRFSEKQEAFLRKLWEKI